MNTNRLSKDIEKILNRQVNKEAAAAQIYLSFGTWADDAGYSGTANLLFRHSQEERDHMMKVAEYIMLRGGRVRITGLDEPPGDPENLMNCFERLFKHEVDNSNAINEIVEKAHQERDWATFNFGQWFVKEQIEEEALILDILDMLTIAGGSRATDESLLYFDNKMKQKEDEADLARDVEAENP